MASASLLPIGKRNSEPQAARHDSLVQDRSFLSRNTCPCLTQSLKGEGSSNRGVSKFFEISDWPEIATPLVSLDSYEFELGYQSLDGKTYSKKKWPTVIGWPLYGSQENQFPPSVSLYPSLTWIFLGCAGPTFGSVNRSTPFVSFASIFP